MTAGAAVAARADRRSPLRSRSPRLPQTSKSPLRYPGGKSRAVETIRAFIPPGTKKLISPFLGGGSVELACAADGMEVHGADLFEPLVNFWRHAKESPTELAERVALHHPLRKEEFYRLQKSVGELDDDLERAAVFFVLNRSSFSGTTLSGGMSPGHPRFTVSAIQRLRDFRADNLQVYQASYQTTLREDERALLYLDPPYANGERLYGQKGDMHDGFNHEKLADELKQRDGWILSYNDDELIRKMYSKYDILTPEWTYGMSNAKQSREILILNL